MIRSTIDHDLANVRTCCLRAFAGLRAVGLSLAQARKIAREDREHRHGRRRHKHADLAWQATDSLDHYRRLKEQCR
jgi:hypothetical protein